MTRRLVIANRGEIARRILRTAAHRGYRVAVISTPEDEDSLVRSEADDVLEVGSFLDGKAIVASAKDFGAHLLHPGYGFLSENAEFAELVESSGIAFVGPDPTSMRASGDKESAKALAIECGVPTLAAVFSKELLGLDEKGLSKSLKRHDIRPPFLVKAAGGGGGRGMRVVPDVHGLPDAIRRASEEASAGFGDSRVFVERLLERARHIEIQVFGDGKGGGLALGERECSIQRRHQKIFEESPSPRVNPQLRERMGKAALKIVQKARYRGAGTVEFLLDESSDFFFLEMNTRLQVEHPVTEAVFGIDLVDAQLELAEGRWPAALSDPTKLSVLTPQAWAMEARILAEDPRRGFVPTPGRLVLYREPRGEGIRVDSGVREGSRVNQAFDSMIAKVIASAKTRSEALDRLLKALDETVALGTETNLPLLRSMVRHPEFAAGEVSTAWLGEELDDLNQPRVPESLRARLTSPGFLGGLSRKLNQAPKQGVAPFAKRFLDVGNRVHRVGSPLEVGPIEIAGPSAEGSFRLGGDGLHSLSRKQSDGGGPSKWRYDTELRHLLAAGVDATKNPGAEQAQGCILWAAACPPAELQFQMFGEFFREKDPRRSPRVRVDSASDGQVFAPMAGKVLEVRAAEGETVALGDILFVVESMKMQLEVKAPIDGVVANVHVKVGQVLDGADVMAEIRNPVTSEQ